MNEPRDDARPVRAKRCDDGPGLVVVGIDPSEGSWRAFAWACGHARRSGCPLLAVHVSRLSYFGGFPEPTGCTDTVVTTASAVADELATRVRRAEEIGVEVAFEHLLGDPASTLVAAAREHGADLLVVGASSHAVHRIVGGVPGRAVRDRRVPVVVVP